MDISLPPNLEQFVADKVISGQFDTPSAVIRGALEVMKEEETLTSADVQELRSAIAIGLDQLDRGEGKPWNIEEIKAILKRRLAQNTTK